MRTLLTASILAFSLMTSGAFAAQPMTISGLVAKPLKLSMTDLRKLAATRIVVKQVSGKGHPVALNCSGPALNTVLGRARLALPPGKNPNLRHMLVITADDDYSVVLSLGEIDPAYGDAAPLLATQCNGAQLSAPRLVMPKDKGASRSVHGIVHIQVR